MSFLTDINCSTILEAIKNEKSKNKNSESETEGFVNINLQVNTFWTDLFANCFLVNDYGSCSKEGGATAITNTLTHDDMLFFVSKIALEENKIEVYRRDSKLCPCLTDLNYDWEETVYLNLILHEFEYTLTCAICKQEGAKNLEILKRHSKRVFASPSKRDLSSKGTEETMTYPNIYFTIDDFDDAFNEMIVKENEMVCVELVANDGRIRKVLFLGSIKYESLRKVYDARASATLKVVQKMTLGFNTFAEKRVEFVKMKGPGGKGYAEMAVSRYQNVNNQPVPSTLSESSNNYFEFSNFLKISNVLKKPTNTTTTTPNSQSSSSALNDSSLSQESAGGFSLLNKHFNQALTWFKPNDQTTASTSKPSNTITNETNNYETNNKSNNKSISLNAYLTYVTLKLPLIMQDVLETRQKSMLTF